MPYALRSGDIAGAVVVVVKDGQVLLQKGFGYADVDRRTPIDAERTLLRPGSVSKLFTWTAVMQLVEQRRLDLDRDINAYLDFRIPEFDERPVTLRNLMTHTPGFEEVLKNLMVNEPGRLLPLGAYLKAWTPARIFPSGAVPAYSNYGAALAGYIVERVSGERFDDYIDRHILKPLGMTHSTFRQPLPPRLAPTMSSGYIAGSGPAQPYELVGPAPAGSLAATGADMARFMVAHLQDGGRGAVSILRPETARAMQGTALFIVPPLHSMLLGFYQRDMNGHRIIAHDGDTQFFHSALSLYPDDGVGLFLSMNSAGKNGAAGPLRSALLEQFTDRYFPGPEDTRALDTKTTAEHARLVAGTYQSSRRAQTTFMSLLSLATELTVKADADGTIRVPALVGLNGAPKKWREVTPFVWQAVGGKDRLAARMENGKVVMLSVDEVSPFMVFQPVPWWKSSSWLVPLLMASCGVLVLTGAVWPISALLRWHYGASCPHAGPAARSYLLVRLAAVGVLAVLAAWVATLAPVTSNLFVYSTRLDWWIWVLHVMTLIVVAAAVVIGVWNARAVWTGTRGWFARLWNTMIAVAFLGVLWIAVVFKLLAVNAHY